MQDQTNPRVRPRIRGIHFLSARFTAIPALVAEREFRRRPRTRGGRDDDDPTKRFRYAGSRTCVRGDAAWIRVVRRACVIAIEMRYGTDPNLTAEPKTSRSNVSLHFVADNCPNDGSPISPLYRAVYSRRGGFYDTQTD